MTITLPRDDGGPSFEEPERRSDGDEAGVRARVERSIELLARGELVPALRLADEAEILTRQASCSANVRAAALCQLGACEYKVVRLTAAVANLSCALDIAEQALPRDERLCAEILEWRSRCYLHQRDFAAAGVDCERGLAFARLSGDSVQLAHLHFQAALVAHRCGDWSCARAHADIALERYTAAGDDLNRGRTLNNLGAFLFLAGEQVQAEQHLAEAQTTLSAIGHETEFGQALASVAQIKRRSGQPEEALADVERAIGMLGDRADFLDEIGYAHLVRGEALMDLSRFVEAETALNEAEALFTRCGSVGHQAKVWVSLGDLSLRRGDPVGAVPHYLRAALATQDVHF
jgi:tetratricopeptide (TPR) repeat protein